MPFPNEHSCRLRDPGDFQDDSFRRMEREHEGKKYSVIMGRLKGETTMTEQAYRYPKDTWDMSECRSHCKSHEGSFEAASGGERQVESSTLRFKMLRPEVKVLNEAAGTVAAVVSTEGRDRDGDIIRQSGWSLERFKEHPVLLSSHNYMSLRSVIGRWDTIEVQRKKLVGTARYFVGEGNEEADWAFKLAKRGLAAFSVGFLPDMSKAKEIPNGDGDALRGLFPNFEFNGQELLEVSQVTIPSNADALQQMKGFHPLLDEVVGEFEASPEYKAKQKPPHGEDCGCCKDCEHCEKCDRCENCGKKEMAGGDHGGEHEGDHKQIADLVMAQLNPIMVGMRNSLMARIQALLVQPGKAPILDISEMVANAIQDAKKEVSHNGK